MTVARLARIGTEALLQNEPAARLARLGTEALLQNEPAARLARLATEAVVQNEPAARLVRLGTEALVSIGLPYGTNVLTNPSFEGDSASPPGGWTAASGTWTNRTTETVTYTVNPQAGSRFVSQTAAVGTALLTQTIVHPWPSQADVAAGLVTCAISGYQAYSSTGDTGRIRVRFYDLHNVEVGTPVATADQHTAGSGAWTPVSAAGLVPTAAYRIRVELEATLVDGTTPNVQFDNLSVSFGTGGGGGGGARRVVVLML